MKRVVIVLGAVVAVLLGAFALIWFVPAVQDRIVQSAMTRQIAKNARAPYLTDDALHILLCGTGSPMPDMTRANACAAVIAGGRVVVIDAGPGAWSRLAAANIPGAKIDTVLLTHLHSDHIGDLGEVATQSWLGGRKVPLDVYGPPAPEPSERTTDAEGETFGVAGTEAVVKGFAEAYNSDAEFRIAQGHELVPTEAARMIGHDVARPGPEEAVTVYDKDGLKISAFLVNHDPVEPAYGYRIEYGGRAAVVSGDTARVRTWCASRKAPMCWCMRRSTATWSRCWRKRSTPPATAAPAPWRGRSSPITPRRSKPPRSPRKRACRFSSSPMRCRRSGMG